MPRRRRKKYTLHHHIVQEMLNYYSGGLSPTLISREYGISYKTLKQLIKEHEEINGPNSLRIQGYKVRYGR